MAVTRINNNQISDASTGNAYVGINAATKLQNYSVTSTKLANNLTYGSDLTVTGNLTVQGNTTAIDTTYTTIEDPILLLASNQTGSPTVDIGFVGQRGTSNNIAFVWDESADEFVTVYTTTGESNTVISIASYADLHTGNANIGGNLVVNGTTSLVGSVVGNVSLAGNITMGNILTGGQVSAGGNVTGGNVLTGGLVSATGNITSAANIAGGNILATTIVSGASHIGSVVSVSANITGGNLLTGGLVSATGNITSAANIASGNLIATTGVRAVTGYFTGNVDVLGNLNATVGLVYANSGIFYGNATTGLGAAYAGVPGYTPIGNTVIQMGANINNYAQLNFQNINNGSDASADYVLTADNGTDSANFIDLGIGSSTYAAAAYPSYGPNDGYLLLNGGNLLINSANVGKVIKFIVGGSANSDIIANITSTGYTSGGTISAAGNITSASNIAGGNILATTIVSGASHIGSVVSVSANITGGNILTGGLVSVTGNVTSAANVLGGNLVATTAVLTPTVIGTTVTVSSTGGLITLAPSSNVSVSSKNINSLADPVQAQDAATKNYVDNMVSTQITYHSPVVAATTGTLETATGGTIAYAQPNGAGNGVGATLTVSGGTFNLIDTANIQTANTRVLVKNQANSALNGIYTWSNATVLVRATDADTYGPDSTTDLSINDYFFVSSGNVNAGSAWVVNGPTGTITFGTSNITFAQFSSSQTYTGGNGILFTGTVISAKVDNNTTAFDGGGNIIVKASANLTTPNIGAATGTSLSVTGNLSGAGGNISGNITGGNLLTGGVVSATGNISSAGNITASYYFGNGSQLTGVTASTSGFPVTAGTSNIAAATNGNIGVTIGGTSNVLTIASTGIFTTGVASTSGNVTAGNVLTGGLISSTGNITSAANVSGGNLVATTIVSGASVLGTIVSASANITGGNILTGGLVSATGNITSAANVAGANVIASANLVAVGAVVSGNITSGNILTGGLISATGNITGGNLITPNLVSATTVIASGNSIGANVNTSSLTLNASTINSNAARITVNSNSSDVDFAVNGTGANIFYIDAGTNTASFGSSAQTTNAILALNATNSFLMPVGNTAQRPATGVTGMLRFNSTLDAVEVYDSDSWTTVGTPSFTVISDQQFSGDSSNTAFTLSAATTTNSTIVSINGIVQIPTIAYSVGGAGANVLTFTEAPETGDLIDVRALTTTTQVTSISNSPGNAVVSVSPTSAQVNITGTLSLSNIINSGANGTGNIGNSTGYFNTVFAKATSAQYADLAEVYAADAKYESGTVLSFGGEEEVTISTTSSDTRIAGVVSTNPSYVMNATLNTDYPAVVALTGRVPTKVYGTVSKGDMMVSGGNGRAIACATPSMGTVIGKALENHSGGDGVIEVVVGRM